MYIDLLFVDIKDIHGIYIEYLGVATSDKLTYVWKNTNKYLTLKHSKCSLIIAVSYDYILLYV